jgi:hypothetical protein
MSEQVVSLKTAYSRLNALLPLGDRYAGLPAALRGLHRRVLEGFAQHGRAPGRSALAGGDVEALDAALSRLAQADLIVLGGDGEIAGAYPFTMEATPHRLELPGCTAHAMCAVDALAVSPMFEVAVRIESVCHETGQPVRVAQRGVQIDPEPAGLHVGIRWQAPGACAARSLCREMVFLASREAAGTWSRAVENRSVFDLPTAVALASAFFLPLVREQA